MSLEIVELKICHNEVRKNEPKKNHNKIYIFIAKENLSENFINRKNRPYDYYRKNVLPLMMEKIKFEHPKIYKKIESDKWGWNQRCGCFCPCSPGFIGEISPYDNYTISLTISL